MEISKMENEYERFLKIYKKNKREIILYGAGAGADWAIGLLQKNNLKPSAIVDKSTTGLKKGINILNYEQFIDIYMNKEVYIIVASPRYEDEIIAKLCENFNEEDIFSFECELYYHYIESLEEYRLYLRENEESLAKFCDMLEDDFSKKTFENVLKGRISGQLKYFKEVYVDDQYFPDDIITLDKEDVFVDVGAYVGDTVEQIVDKCKGKYKKIYCFEPDDNVRDLLIGNTSKYDNIEIINKGAWNQKETLYFQEDSNHGASSISNQGENLIELERIDKCITEDVRITHIKMDIEGAELNALKGADSIIKKDRPQLAICVYHKIDDFLKISEYLLSIMPEYKLYLRHHNISGTETVLYAIKR